LNYEYYGLGQKTIVFLHGWGGSVSSFKWFADSLQTRYRVLVVDFAGFGKSQPPNRPYDVDDYVDEVIDLLKHLNIRNYYIVAHSFGGRVAIKMCARGEMIERLILVDSAGIKPRFSIKKWSKIVWYKFIKFLVKLHLLSRNRLDKYGSKDYKSLDGVMKATFLKVVNEDLSKNAKKISCPTLLVWGDRDAETPFYMAKKLNKYIRNSALVIIKNAGHFSYLDNPVLFLNIMTKMFEE